MYPVIKNGKKVLRDVSSSKAYELYGAPLPEEVEKRMNNELSIICSNDYEVFYLIEKALIEKADLRKNHSTRGNESNSFIAFLCGISCINPLPPHFRCEKGHYSDFDSNDPNMIGTALQKKRCPICGKPLIGDGYSLPFEFFIHNREPFFELFVSASETDKVVGILHDLFGSDRVLRVGIGGGVYPGRWVVIPKECGEITDCFPVKYIDGELVADVSLTDMKYLILNIYQKQTLDFLDRLQTTSGCTLADIPITGIPISELLVKDEHGKYLLNGIVGSHENSLRDLINTLLSISNEYYFEDLIKVIGISDGYGLSVDDVVGLLNNGISFREIIANREDCYDFFIQYGFEKSQAFHLTDYIRKGRLHRNPTLYNECYKIMKDKGMPEWYIESTKRIRYLCHRGYSVSEARTMWQLLYYKRNFPDTFYRSYIDVWADKNNKTIIQNGKMAVLRHMECLEPIEYDENYEIVFERERNREYELFLVAKEMYDRGYNYKV